MRSCRHLVLVLLVTAAATAAAAGESPFPQARPLEGVHNALDVPYLPDRITGDIHDRWVTMNLHWPKQGGPHPCIIFIHGGGYGAGDKDGRYGGAGGPPRKLMEQAVRHGFVVVNLNYILGKGIQPLVFHDFKNAVRFLRANAARYSIDPNRIAAWGFSAGGWLATSGGFTTADDLKPVPRTDLGTIWSERRDRNRVLLIPYDDPRSPYADHSARLTAIVADFWSKRELPFYGPDDPAILTYVGRGGHHGLVKLANEVGNEGQQIVLTDERYHGKSSLHVPPVDAPCLPLAGDGQSTLQDEAFRWLKQKLVEHPKMVAPEARPIRRHFADAVTVRLIAPGDAVIRYTTDGSEPDENSPAYKQTLQLTTTTTVKSRAFQSGFAPSAVAVATFTKGEVPPVITGPDTLPEARVGQPYRVALTAEGQVGWWNLSGHAESQVKMHTKIIEPPLGIALDPKTGILSGTPTRAGSFTLHVQAAAGFGQPADARAYVFVVRE